MGCTLSKIPVYILWGFACVKQTEMVQQSIYSLKIDNFEYHKSGLIQHKNAWQRIC